MYDDMVLIIRLYNKDNGIYGVDDYVIGWWWYMGIVGSIVNRWIKVNMAEGESEEEEEKGIWKSLDRAWRMLESLGDINADALRNGKIVHFSTNFSTLLKNCKRSGKPSDALGYP